MMDTEKELKIIEARIIDNFGPATLSELQNIANDPSLIADCQKIADEIGIDQVKANLAKFIRETDERRRARQALGEDHGG